MVGSGKIGYTNLSSIKKIDCKGCILYDVIAENNKSMAAVGELYGDQKPNGIVLKCE